MPIAVLDQVGNEPSLRICRGLKIMCGMELKICSSVQRNDLKSGLCCFKKRFENFRRHLNRIRLPRLPTLPTPGTGKTRLSNV